jgi:hypothetical protein
METVSLNVNAAGIETSISSVKNPGLLGAVMTPPGTGTSSDVAPGSKAERLAIRCRRPPRGDARQNGTEGRYFQEAPPIDRDHDTLPVIGCLMRSRGRLL